MNLPIPIVGQDPGPDWANNINASLGILDQHDHSNGEGVPITPAGININIDLPMNGNNLTLVNTVRFNNLVSSLAGTTPNLGCIYEAVNNLYFNDGVGNVVQLTKSGSVNATSSGISSGTATASFVGGVLVVDSNVNTPANVQGASFLFGNNVANSKYLTLEPPTAMAANYTVILPPINTTGGTAFMTYDASNDMGIGPAVQNGITRSNLAPVGQQISASCGAFSTSSGSFVTVTNLSVTLTTSGRPVFLALQPDNNNTNPTGSFVELDSPSAPDPEGYICVFRDGTEVSYALQIPHGETGTVWRYPLLGFLCLDVPGAGTYTYTVQAAVLGATTVNINYAVLVAFEL